MARTEAIEATASAERARAEQKRLQVELEHERVERLRFEREFAWRTLSSTQENSLVQDLSVAPSAINVEFVSNDPEVTFLAIQFQRIFKAAGWKVEAVANTYAGSVFFGIFVSPTPHSEQPTVPPKSN